jgi:DNA-binding IclR family transcriptional regulator
MPETLKSVDHALSVMEYLAGASDPQTLTALSHEFGLSKASMHRLLATLRSHGYVVKDPVTARYGFGLTASRLAQQAGAGDGLTEACWPAMRWLWKRTEETVLLAVRDGDTAVIVEKIDSNRPVLATYSLGRLMPLHAVSAGLALLSGSPDAEVRELLSEADLAAFTAHSPRTMDAVWYDIRTARLKGYAINRERFRDGVCGVSAPIFGLDRRRPAAAIALCVPAIRFEAQLDSMCEFVVAAARRASDGLTIESKMKSDEFSPGKE